MRAAPSDADTRQLMQRRVDFDCNRYLREGFHFFKWNCCVLFCATLVLGMIAILCGTLTTVGSIAIAQAARNHHRSDNGWEGYSPYPRPIDNEPRPYPMPYPEPRHSEPYPLPVNPTQSLPVPGTTGTTGITKTLPSSPSAPGTVTSVPVTTMPEEPSEDGDQYMDGDDMPGPEDLHSSGSKSSRHHHMKRRMMKGAFACHVIAYIIGSMFMIFIGYPLMANCFLAVFNAIRENRELHFCDIFSSLPCARYCRILALGLMISVIRGLLTLLFIVPGVWFSIVSLFAVPLFADRGLGAWKSIKVSVKVLNRHFCSFFCFILLLGLMQLAGIICVGVGVLYTMPVAFVSLCYCYHHLVGVAGMEVVGDSESDAPIPMAHPVALPVHPVPSAPANAQVIQMQPVVHHPTYAPTSSTAAPMAYNPVSTNLPMQYNPENGSARSVNQVHVVQFPYAGSPSAPVMMAPASGQPGAPVVLHAIPVQYSDGSMVHPHPYGFAQQPMPRA